MMTLHPKTVDGVIAVLMLGVATIADAKADLVAHWKFDEAPGSSTAFDSSSSGLDGVLAGGADFIGGGVSGNAINLNAADALVNMGDVLDGTFSGGDFTVSLWVKTLSTAIDTIVVSKHEGGSTNGNFVGINTSAGYGQISRTYFYTADPVGGEVVSTSPVTDNVWRQIVAVYNAGGTKSIYVDGTPAEDSGPSSAISGNNADFLVGGVWFAAGGPVDRYFGWVDDVQIYDSALSDDEIQFLFTNPGATNPIPIPAAVWLFGSAIGLLGWRQRKVA